MHVSVTDWVVILKGTCTSILLTFYLVQWYMSDTSFCGLIIRSVFMNGTKNAFLFFFLFFFFLEFIITFNGYYLSSARSRFITSALRDADADSWDILPRTNPAYALPSDFEVLKVL